MTDAMTLPGLLRQRAATTPDAVASWSKRQGIWRRQSWRETEAAKDGVAAMLATAGFGPGDHLLLLGESSAGWIAADLAAQSLGGRSLCVHPDATPAQLAAAVQAVPVAHAMVDNAGVLRQAGLDLPFTLLHGAIPEAPRATASPPTDDIATLVVTAGGEILPLSHRSLIGSAQTLADTLGLRHGPEDLLCQLPFADVAERLLGPVLQLVQGGTLFFAESIDTVATALREVAPGMVSALPWQWDMLCTQIFRRLQDLPPPLQRFAKAATQRPSALTGLLLARPLRRQLGLHQTRLRLCHGGTPAADTTAFFANIGLPLTQNWAPA
jgi:long-chain acyl-CoA synthetase